MTWNKATTIFSLHTERVNYKSEISYNLYRDKMNKECSFKALRTGTRGNKITKVSQVMKRQTLGGFVDHLSGNQLLCFAFSPSA